MADHENRPDDEMGLRTAMTRLLRRIAPTSSINTATCNLSDLGRRVYEAVSTREQDVRQSCELRLLESLVEVLHQHQCDQLRIIEGVTRRYRERRENDREVTSV